MSEYQLEVGVFEEGGSIWPKISGRMRRTSPNNHLCTVRQASECLTTLPLTAFGQRHCVADFLRKKKLSHEKRSICVFESPFGA